MNCDTCIFKNNSKITIEGNCPEIEETEGEKEKEKEYEDEEGKTLIIIISIVFAVIIIVIVLIVLYFTCYKKGKCRKEPSAYLNIDGKNISFEDDLGIN